MREKGFDRSPTMCTDKWRNLLKEFKKAKYQGSTGSGSVKMSYYKEIKEILRERSKSGQCKSPIPTSDKVDTFMQFSDKGIDDISISFGQVGQVEDDSLSQLDLTQLTRRPTATAFLNELQLRVPDEFGADLQQSAFQFSGRVLDLEFVQLVRKQLVMAEETLNPMNLDLNLGPSPEPGLIPGPVPSEAVNLDELIEGPIRRIRDATRHRARQRWRWRQVLPLAQQNISMELNELMVNSSNETTVQAGEGSAAAEERTNDATKTCEINTCFFEDGETDKKDDAEKGGGNEGSFFGCNICLDLAREPVVTCCGHLFCWPCIYQWLHVHADVKECPVCKGEVTIKNVTPIYGRGNSARIPEEDSSLEIPVRPHARRVESFRQTFQRTAFNIPMEEMIRRLGSRFDLTGDLTPQQDSHPGREAAGRTSSLLDRFLLSRAMRTREQNPVPPPEDAVGMAQSGNTSSEGENRRLHSYLLRRSHSHRHAAAVSSAFTAERLVEAYFRNHNQGRSQEPPPVDDRDSFSSIAAVINSESQLDTAMEIDSVVSFSTSTSRRRNDPSRVSDLDSGDSRASRRRRLN